MPTRAPTTEVSPAAGGTQTNADNPQTRKQVEAGRQVAYHLLKGLKVIALYRHNESKYGEYLTRAWEALTEYTREYGTLALRVELTNFTLLKQELFAEDNPIPYKFFKDGVRQIVFRHGFTLAELTTFIMIALSDPDRGADDINVQLWRAQMPNFEYVMIEGFKIDDMNDEEVKAAVDNVVDYLQQRLRTNSDDFVRFVRLSESDLELEMEEIDQMRGLVVTGQTATPELKAKVQREVRDEETQRLFPKLVIAVFQVLESGVSDAGLLTDMFSQLLDAMLLQEDFMVINQVVLKLRAMEQRAGEDSAIGELLREFILKMGEEQRLSRIGEILRYSKVKHPSEVVKYLTTLTQSAVPALLGTLELVELAENRALLCDVLVPFARVNPAHFVEKLATTEIPKIQRDMIYVLDRSNHPDKLKFFSDMLKSKNLTLKLEVMAIVARGRTGEARRQIAALLTDETLQVRLQAARVLPEFGREEACRDLLAVIKDKTFEHKPAQEREGFYVALASTDVTSAIEYFGQLLQQKGGLFSKQKLIVEKTLLVGGLGGACTIRCAKVLQELSEDKTQPPEVVQAARMHLARVRKQLFGSAVRES